MDVEEVGAAEAAAEVAAVVIVVEEDLLVDRISKFHKYLPSCRREHCRSNK